MIKKNLRKIIVIGLFVVSGLLALLWIILPDHLPNLWVLIQGILAFVAALLVNHFLKKLEETVHETEELPGQFSKFTYNILCTRCNNDFSYKYSQVLKEKGWTKGYVRCPYCDTKNAHTGIRFKVEEGE